MKATCPCCGYKTLPDFPGSYCLCPICFWEDDGIQLLDPWYAGGANQPSLVQAQGNFSKFGACEEDARGLVRKPHAEDEMDSSWRPVSEGDRQRTKLPVDIPDESWNRREMWYYWLSSD